MVTPCLDYLELSGSWIQAKYQAHKVLFLSSFTFLKIKPELRNLKQNLLTNILILCLGEQKVFYAAKFPFTRIFAKCSSLSSYFPFFVGLIVKAHSQV